MYYKTLLLLTLQNLQFQSEDSVELALQLNGENIKERQIRVSRCGKIKEHNKKSSTDIESKIKQKMKKQKLGSVNSRNAAVGKKSKSENIKVTQADGMKPKNTKLNGESYQGQTALAHKKVCTKNLYQTVLLFFRVFIIQ